MGRTKERFERDRECQLGHPCEDCGAPATTKKLGRFWCRRCLESFAADMDDWRYEEAGREARHG